MHGPEGEDETQEEFNRGELAALVNIQYEQRQDKPAEGKLESKRLYPHRDRERARPARLTSHWTTMKHEMLEAVNERFGESEVYEEDSPQLVSELNAPMEKQEIDVVVGALQMKNRVAMDVFTPRSHLYSIPDDLVLDRKGMTEIYAKGYSRVPVYCNEEDRDDEDNQSCIIGFLMTRQLMMIDWDHEREVCTLPLVRPTCVSPRRNLIDLLKLLRSGGSLMAFVCARPDLGNRALQAEQPLPDEAGFIGIVTLEDILESILQQKIYDERDIKDRDRAVATLNKWAAEKLQNFVRTKVSLRRHSFSENQSNTPVTENTPLLETVVSKSRV